MNSILCTVGGGKFRTFDIFIFIFLQQKTHISKGFCCQKSKKFPPPAENLTVNTVTDKTRVKSQTRVKFQKISPTRRAGMLDTNLTLCTLINLVRIFENF